MYFLKYCYISPEPFKIERSNKNHYDSLIVNNYPDAADVAAVMAYCHHPDAADVAAAIAYCRSINDV